MLTDPDRRQFLTATGAAFAALAASGCRAAPPGVALAQVYGPLRADPAKMLDLAEGFSYQVISRLGDVMDDGARVPDAADGMGCFALPGGKLALVRNHELRPGKDSGGASGPAFDAAPGGTTTLVLDAQSLRLERQFRSLNGTIRNCAGGITPWGSWLTCEEDVSRAGGVLAQDHGWVFEVPANASGPVDPVPLKAMGRFNHEAAAVDPITGHVYLTEDRDDGLLYRFVPRAPGKLAQGGTLQALALADGGAPAPSRPGQKAKLRWIDLDQVESPKDDLRTRGAALGALPFARGEGIHLGIGRGDRRELYFVATAGGAAELGQIWRLHLNGQTSELELFFESTDPDQFNYGDNITVAPNGHLIVCEDQYGRNPDNYLRAITPQGQPYALGRVHGGIEPAGACFSPDGRVLFVNLQSPTATLAITGPWTHLTR
jgi:hypothetical protein